MAIVVTGIGLVSALGELDDTWKQLLHGKSGIQSHQPFPELAAMPLALIGEAPVDLVELTQRVVRGAIRDAGLGMPLLDCGVVVGSSRGNQAQWEQLARGRGDGEQRGWGAGETGSRGDGEQDGLVQLALHRSMFPDLASLNWLDTLPHAAAIATARMLGTTGPVLAPMAACATGIWAIAQGAELIQSGQCQRVLAGAVEAPITPLTLTGFERMGALAKTGAYPFDRDREGLVLGEGGAILVLETDSLARQRGAKIYGQILGFGLTADGYHVSAPAPGSGGAIAAVQQCLDRSGLTANAIDYIHAHGTATRLNDRHEAQLLQQLFPWGVPVSSTKGATGHTIGASGTFGAAFCLKALRHQYLPPCQGLRDPEFMLKFVTASMPAKVAHTLCLSFGFGGQNAAIVLGDYSSVLSAEG